MKYLILIIFMFITSISKGQFLEKIIEENIWTVQFAKAHNIKEISIETLNTNTKIPDAYIFVQEIRFDKNGYMTLNRSFEREIDSKKERAFDTIVFGQKYCPAFSCGALDTNYVLDYKCKNGKVESARYSPFAWDSFSYSPNLITQLFFTENSGVINCEKYLYAFNNKKLEKIEKFIVDVTKPHNNDVTKIKFVKTESTRFYYVNDLTKKIVVTDEHNRRKRYLSNFNLNSNKLIDSIVLYSFYENKITKRKIKYQFYK